MPRCNKVLDKDVNTNDDVTYVAQQIKEKNKPSDKELSILKALCINLIHEVLPQHRIESCAGSHVPTKSEMKQFENIISVKKGSYSPQEDEIITRNWKKFCKYHNWNKKNVTPFLLLRQGNKSYIRSKRERQKFVQFIANGLPHRTLYSVYHRFRNLYSHHLQRRYDAEEDKMIIEHIENNPNLNEKRKYVDLATVLKRTRASIWRRYQILLKRRIEN
ncbi:hypothetical protein KM043_015574 [Ampulex compressa]|nr:hypothetical protein KM043_015574 [Ampulex compressa]